MLDRNHLLEQQERLTRIQASETTLKWERDRIKKRLRKIERALAVAPRPAPER